MERMTDTERYLKSIDDFGLNELRALLETMVEKQEEMLELMDTGE